VMRPAEPKSDAAAQLPAQRPAARAARSGEQLAR
jgi:hypothetical protein